MYVYMCIYIYKGETRWNHQPAGYVRSGMVKHRHHSAGIPHNKTVSAEVTQPEQARQSERVTWPICAWARGSYSEEKEEYESNFWLIYCFMTFHQISWRFLWHVTTFDDARFLMRVASRVNPWHPGAAGAAPSDRYCSALTFQNRAVRGELVLFLCK